MDTSPKNYSIYSKSIYNQYILLIAIKLVDFITLFLAAMQAGMAMAQQMMSENPEAVEEMRRMMGGMMGGGSKPADK